MTANSAHSPRATDEALVRATADLRLLVLPKATAMVATTMVAMERNLDAILEVVLWWW